MQRKWNEITVLIVIHDDRRKNVGLLAEEVAMSENGMLYNQQLDE